ncbi:MAG: RsmG family class I SAM-dependent methyltransferase, partial [Planctomycetota bacterium]
MVPFENQLPKDSELLWAMEAQKFRLGTMELTSSEFSARFIAALGPFAPGFAREALALHAWRVRERNEVMNLTRITEPEEMAIRHAADSLAALPLLAEGGETLFKHVLDLGTGAGYPGLSIALACPHPRRRRSRLAPGAPLAGLIVYHPLHLRSAPGSAARPSTRATSPADRRQAPLRPSPRAASPAGQRHRQAPLRPTVLAARQ